MKILLAVDGSKNAMDAVDCLIDHAGWYRDKPQVELVTVHLPVPRLPNMSMVVGRKELARYYEEEGKANLARAEKRLASAKLPYKAHVLVGPIAETLSRFAADQRCDLILIGTRGMSAAANAVLGSTATKLLQLASVPVLVVR
jgi:nucleotide-binding universal stress UspA family protein